MTKIFVAAWFLVALGLSLSGWFAQFPAAVLFAIGTVVSAIAFLLLHRYHTGFRAWARAADLKHLTEAQVFRFYGLLAFEKAREHVLPAVFAIPTGIIDVSIAATAFFVAGHWVTSVRVSSPRRFFLWHVAGLCGLAISVVLVILTATPRFGLVDAGHTSQPMAEFPMNLVPTFVGPLVLVMHLLALTEAHERVSE